MKKLQLILCLSLIYSFSHAQLVRNFVNDYKIYTGFNTIGLYNTNNFDDFKVIYPQVLDMPTDVSVYPNVETNDSYFDFITIPYPNFFISASISHKLKKPNLNWGIGVNYISSMRDVYNQEISGYRYYDQQLDSSNSVVSYKDSGIVIQADYSVNAKKIALENSFYFRTNELNRFSMVFGLCFQVGVLKPRYAYNYRAEKSYNLYDSLGNKTVVDVSVQTMSLKLTGKTNPYASFNFLVGFDIKLSMKDNFLRNTHLFSEFKPGMCVHYIPEVKKTRATSNGLFSLVGLRFTLGN